MFFKRLVQAATAVLALAAAVPGSAQQVLKVGSTPTGVPFTFLDTKTNSIQGVMVDLITEIGKDAGFQVQIEPMRSISPMRSTPMARVSWCRRPTRRTMPRRKI